MTRITAETVTRLSEQAVARRGWISDLLWSPNGRSLAVASAEGIVFFEADTLRLLAALRGHEGPVKHMAVDADGARLVSAGADTTVRLWKLREGGACTVLRGHCDSVEAVAFSPDGTRLASASTDRAVRVWDAQDGTPLAVLEGHSAEIAALTYGAGGRLASGGWDQMVVIWDAQGQVQHRLEHGDWVRHLTTSADRALLASSSRDETVRVWDWERGAEQLRLFAHAGGADAAAFSPDGRLLATGGRDLTVKVWLLPEGALLHTLTGFLKPVLTLAFSPDGTRLATGSGDNRVQVWGVSQSDSDQ